MKNKPFNVAGVVYNVGDIVKFKDEQFVIRGFSIEHYAHAYGKRSMTFAWRGADLRGGGEHVEVDEKPIHVSLQSVSDSKNIYVCFILIDDVLFDIHNGELKQSTGLELIAKQAPGPLNDCTVADIVCYLLFVNGPMSKEQLLKACATLQGKPYIKGNNNSDFANVPEHNGRKSLIVKGLITKVGKVGRTFFYCATPKGLYVGGIVAEKHGSDLAQTHKPA